MNDVNQFLLTLGIDTLSVLGGLLVLFGALFYFLRRRKRNNEDNQEHAARLKKGITEDPITSQPKPLEEIHDVMTPLEEDVPSLNPVPDVEITTPQSNLVTPIEPKLTFPDEPPVRVTAPEPMPMKAPEPEGRIRPNVDPMLECFARFNPRELTFRTDKLVQIAVLLEQAGMQDIVHCDYYNATTKRWSETFRDNDNCTELVVTMPLVNRQGPIDEIECSRFIQLADQIAIELEADDEVPECSTTIDAAQRLATLSDEFDNTLNLVVASETSIDAEALKNICLNSGFIFDDVAFVKYAPTTKTPMTKVNLVHREGEEPKEISLSLHVALANASSNPLQEFLAFSNELCCKLNGHLQDANGHRLGQDSISFMDREIKQLYAVMRSRGIPAGSKRALRLYAK